MTTAVPEVVSGTSDVIQIDAPAETEKVEMVPLFAVDGKTYKIPSRIPPNVSLQILAKVEERGVVFGEIYMLRTVLGDSAFDALLSSAGLKEEHMTAIAARVQKVVFGKTEEEGND
jgi:hypothetical protein